MYKLWCSFLQGRRFPGKVKLTRAEVAGANVSQDFSRITVSTNDVTSSSQVPPPPPGKELARAHNVTCCILNCRLSCTGRKMFNREHPSPTKWHAGMIQVEASCHEPPCLFAASVQCCLGHRQGFQFQQLEKEEVKFVSNNWATNVDSVLSIGDEQKGRGRTVSRGVPRRGNGPTLGGVRAGAERGREC